MNIIEQQTSSVSNSIIEVDESLIIEASNDDVEFSDHSKLPVAPVVSIDMITYQHAPFIREAIDSVLMQKVDFAYEICIGEDGSTDGTREICLEYARKYPDKIRLFLRNRSNPKRKSFKAPYMFNAASTFDACRGNYVAMLEGDDYWLHPHKLQAQVNQLESDLSFAASCHYAACGQDRKPWAWKITPSAPVQSFAVQNLLKRDVGNLHTSTWLLRRRKPVNWNQFRTSSFGDYPIMVSALLDGKAHVSPHTWSFYRIHEGGVFSPLSTEIRLRENVELWKCLQSILTPELATAGAVGMSRTLTMLIAALSKSGKFSSAIACLRQNFTEISKIQPASEQRQLRFFAIEALVFPYLRGLRERWTMRNSSNQL